MAFTRQMFVTGMIVVVIFVIAAGAIALAIVSAVKTRKSDPLHLGASRPAEEPTEEPAEEPAEEEVPVRLAAPPAQPEDPYFSSLDSLGPSGDSMPEHFVTGSFDTPAPSASWSEAPAAKLVRPSRANPRPQFQLREDPTRVAPPLAPSTSLSPTPATSGFQSLQDLGDSGGGFDGFSVSGRFAQQQPKRPNTGILSSTLMNPHGASAGGPPRPRDPSASQPPKLTSASTGTGGLGMARLPPRKAGTRPSTKTDPSSRRGQLLL